MRVSGSDSFPPPCSVQMDRLLLDRVRLDLHVPAVGEERNARARRARRTEAWRA